MSAASRRKGLTGEREVAGKFTEHGWTMRGLEGSGDWIAVSQVFEDEYQSPGAYQYMLHIECKRAERLRLPEWIEQARTEAPPGVPWLLALRQNRGEWIACLPLDELLRMVG